MKKATRTIALSVLVLLTAATFAMAAPEPVNLGQDANKMQWYLVNYGKGEYPFASARRVLHQP